MLSSYTPPQPATSSTTVESAEKEKLVADMNYDLILLQKEARSWTSYLSQNRLFNAETHNAKVQEQQAIVNLLRDTGLQIARGHVP